MNSAQLLTHFERISEAPDAIPRLRQLVLGLAVRGKLVEQDPNDEPALELLRRVQIEKVRLLKAGKIKETKRPSMPIPDNVLYEVPKNWKWVRLGTIVNTHLGGGTPAKGNSTYWDGDIRWASVKDVGKGKYIDDTTDRITAAGLADSSSNLIPPGNLIVVTRMGLGKVAINRVPIAINQDLRALSLSSLVAIDYYYICFKTHSFEGTGLTVKGIKVEELLDIAFPLPPLTEQHRIVKKVDELMALCDQVEAADFERERRRDRFATASMQRLNEDAKTDAPAFREHVHFHIHHLSRVTTRSEHIRQLRQTILNLAVRGRLVPQYPHDKPAQAVFEAPDFRNADFDASVFSAALATITVPPNWRVAPLARVCAAIVDCPHSTPKWTSSGKICIRTNQFRPGRLDLSDVRFVSETTFAERIERLRPIKDDILYSREGGILGVACRVPSDVELCLGQRMMLIRAGASANPVFLEMVLNSPLITEIARSRTTGGAAPRVNVATVKAYPIPLPPLPEQQRIVVKVDELMALCDHLELHLTTAQAESRRLLEVVLHQSLARAA